MTPKEEVGRALRAVQRLDAPVRAVMARRLGLGHTDVQALDLLRLPPDGIGPVELGELLGIRSASATALVDRLEAAGHVTRARHPSDRRRVVVEPTEAARRDVIEVLAPLITGWERAASELSADEASAVIRYLRRIAGAMERYVAEGGDRAVR